MSTRSNIAIEKPDGTIQSIYVHSDGYPDGVGQMLINNYPTYGSSLRLFEHGDCSSLGATLEECSFYHRDWERKLDPAQVHKNYDEFKTHYRGDVFIEFVYLFDRTKNQWLVSDNYRKNELEFVPIGAHKDYTGKQPDMTEKDMIGSLKDILTKGFGNENVSVQTFDSKKRLN